MRRATGAQVLKVKVMDGGEQYPHLVTFYFGTSVYGTLSAYYKLITTY